MHFKKFGKLVFYLSFILILGVGCGRSDAPSTPPMNPSTVPNSQSEKFSFPGQLPAERIERKRILIKTERGDIVIKLFPDTAPKIVSNFIYLAEAGFYNGLTFHRREEGFVIQGGDPNGNGTGGPGYRFEDELKDSRSYRRGIVAMANAGPNTNGSQFFIMLADVPLSKNYTIFGEVVSGMEVVDAIRIGDRMVAVTVQAE